MNPVTRMIRRTIQKALGIPSRITMDELNRATQEGILAGFAAGPFREDAPRRPCTPVTPPCSCYEYLGLVERLGTPERGRDA